MKTFIEYSKDLALKTVIVSLVVILVAFAVTFLIGFLTTVSPSDTPEVVIKEDVASNKTHFVDACVASGGSDYRLFCACTHDELINRIGTGGFIKLSLAEEKRAGSMFEDENVVEAITYCADKLDK